MNMRDGPDDSRPVSQRVVEAVARESGTDPTKLAPLYGSIDPDSLNELFAEASSAPERTPTRVTFRFVGYRVTVSQDDSVDVDLAESQPPDSSPDPRATESTGKPDAED